MRRRFVLIAACGLAGCNRQTPPAPNVVVVADPPAPPASPETPPTNPPAPDAKTPDAKSPEAKTPDAKPPAPTPPAVAPPPPTFAFPADAAGRELPKVVAPAAPAPLPVERFGGGPRGRVAPPRVVDPDPPARRVFAPPPVLPPRPAGLTPAAPPERVPLDLGTGGVGPPARPVLPVPPAAAAPAPAPDASAPPLAPLGRQVPDRAGLDDPTADAGNAAIVTRSLLPALPPAAFQKVTLPDPFELGEQVKPSVAPANDPGRAPVPVTPKRPK